MRRAWLVLVLASRVASAQPLDVTKEFQAGIDAYRLGKFDEARQHLEKARAADPKLPGPHRFLAAVAQAQSRWDDCIDSAHKALELNPLSSEAADTRKLYESCRLAAGRILASQELGDSAAVAVTTNIPGATVKINGLTYGGTPLSPRPITPGTLDVEIDKPGWKSTKRTVNAIPGVVTDVIVELEPDENAHVANELDPATGEKLKNGYLVIPPGSGTVRIDEGAPPELKNDRFELPAGTHIVELQQPGKDPWRRRVRISAGQKTTLSPMFVDQGSRAATETRGFYVLGAGSALL
ncbi:MAG TPA: PEGA domain-containing protein, partial [Kofleriaceae bacterium]